MKKISMIVHSSLQQELADLLRSLQLESFMFSHIEEHSSQQQDAMLSARDKVVGYVPKVRVDIFLEDERARTLLEEITNSTISFKGKGMYWITDIDETGEL